MDFPHQLKRFEQFLLGIILTLVWSYAPLEMDFPHQLKRCEQFLGII
jgi:hypothetical protein